MSRGAFIFAPEGPRLSQDEAKFFSEADPFGFILFQRNAENPDQLRRLTGDLRSAVGWQAPVFIDQEGGRVARLGPPHWKEWLPPLDDAARLGTLADAGLALRYAVIAAELHAIGIDGNCAPLGDIARPETHAVLRNRCYGTHANAVLTRARAVAASLLDNGILPVLKHMPGQGRANLDSHLELPRVDAPVSELMAEDFQVFKGLCDLPIGMTAHVVFDGIDPLPATQSPRMIQLIRKDIGFGGLLMTDDISMDALSGTPLERARASLQAGCDLVLHCNGNLSEMTSIATLGRLTTEGWARAEHALNCRGPAKAVDLDELMEDFSDLYRRAG